MNFPLGYNGELASSISSLTLPYSATNYPITCFSPSTIAQNKTATSTSPAAMASKFCASTSVVGERDRLSPTQSVAVALKASPLLTCYISTNSRLDAHTSLGPAQSYACLASAKSILRRKMTRAM